VTLSTDYRPRIVDKALKTGDEFAEQLEFLESKGGPALNLTGYAFEGGVTPAAGGAEVAFAFVTDAPNGKVTYSLTEAQTTGLGPGTHRYRLAWVEPGSVKRTLIHGAWLQVP